MPYFKKGGVVIQADMAPHVVPVDSQIIVEGQKLHIEDMNDALQRGLQVSMIVDEFEKWLPASRIEYRIYLARVFDFLASQSRDVKAAMWALNNATEEQLRLGGVWPGDGGNLGGIEKIDIKKQIIASTQHGMTANFTKKELVSNVTFTRWILRKRAEEPFLYVGDGNGY